MQVSKAEVIVRKLLAQKYTSPVLYNTRPEWLSNPATGKRLELDIFYPEERIAIEIQGIHHQTIAQKERDEIKRRVCKERGIELYEVDTTKRSIRKFARKIGLTDVFIPFYNPNPRKGTEMEQYSKKMKHQIWKERGVLEQREEIEANRRRLAIQAA